MVPPDPSIPDVALLESALALLAPDLDAEAIGKGGDDAQRQAALLAHLAAWSLFAHDVVGQGEAELTAPELADLHARADTTVAETITRADAIDAGVVHLQMLRLVWVHHALLTVRAEAPNPLVDVALAGIAGVVDLLAAAQAADRAGANGRAPEPLLRAEALLGRAHQLLVDLAG